MNNHPFTGTSALIRLALRRDRIKLSVWLLVFFLLTASMTASYTELLKTDQELVNMIAMRAENPVIRAFDAPASGASIGAFFMLRSFLTFAVLAALMSAQTVVRHTRQNEETGRSELIGSTVVGRHAGLTAAVIVTACANLLMSALIGLGLIINGLPAAGSLTAGAAFGAIGITFTGIAAIAAQLSDSARGANGLSGMMIGLTVLLSSIGNMLGDVQDNGVRVVSAWPVWLSPVGWGQQIHAFHQNRWSIFGLFAVLFIVLVWTAYFLNARRDAGIGIIPSRRGPASAARSLLSPLGLAWRLQRGVWYAWAMAMTMIGVVFGAISNQIEKMMASNEQVAEIFNRLGGSSALVDAFFAAVMSMMGTIVAIYTVQAVLRMRSEEAEGTLESVLSAAVSRSRWMMSHIVCVVFGTSAILLFVGLAAGITAGFTIGDPTNLLSKLTEAALVQIPAALVLGGFSITAFGLLPRQAVALSWAALAISLITGPMFGALLDLPQALQNISPFTHIPAVPSAEPSAAPIYRLLAAGAALTLAGMAFFRRRSLGL
ncbi:ABC transporter permease [Paenibacillus tarimensis]